MKKPALMVLLSFSVLFLIAAWMIVKELRSQKEDINNFKQLSELITVDPTVPDETYPPSQPQASEPASPASPVRDLTPLFQRNEDCAGWLTVAGTSVDYPVMHTPEDPQRYLHKNFDREYSAAGVPFIDGSCTLECDNLVLYGHNMKNGTMFADITNYRKEDYGTAHPTVELETAQGIQRFSLFAVVQARNDDSWYFFHTAANEAEFLARVAEIQSRALYHTGLQPVYGKQLITLSTCYDTGSTDRIFIIAAEE